MAEHKPVPGGKKRIRISRGDNHSCSFVPTVDYGINFLKELVTDNKILEKNT